MAQSRNTVIRCTLGVAPHGKCASAAAGELAAVSHLRHSTALVWMKKLPLDDVVSDLNVTDLTSLWCQETEGPKGDGRDIERQTPVRRIPMPRLLAFGWHPIGLDCSRFGLSRMAQQRKADKDGKRLLKCVVRRGLRECIAP